MLKPKSIPFPGMSARTTRCLSSREPAATFIEPGRLDLLQQNGCVVLLQAGLPYYRSRDRGSPELLA
jgi:hypothetical protein